MSMLKNQFAYLIQTSLPAREDYDYRDVIDLIDKLFGDNAKTRMIGDANDAEENDISIADNRVYITFSSDDLGGVVDEVSVDDIIRSAKHCLDRLPDQSSIRIDAYLETKNDKSAGSSSYVLCAAKYFGQIKTAVIYDISLSAPEPEPDGSDDIQDHMISFRSTDAQYAFVTQLLSQLDIDFKEE